MLVLAVAKSVWRLPALLTYLLPGRIVSGTELEVSCLEGVPPGALEEPVYLLR